jgi:hypothetical protein
MTALRAGELDRLAVAQEWHMGDTCQVLAYSSTQDAYNVPVATYTAGSEIACGFGRTSPSRGLDRALVPQADAELRLPLGTAVTAQDRIRITQRLGEELDPAEDYEIVGPTWQGPSGLVLKLKKVTE